MAQIGSLVVDLEARTASFNSDLGRAAATLNARSAQMARSVGQIEKRFLGLRTVAVGALAGISFGAVASGIVQINAKFQNLQSQLKTATGSVRAAAATFDSLQKFAARTPFTLDQTVQAFVKLKNLGLDPSERAITSYGNTAAAMGKDLNQMIEAVADASTGEFERLKEFGIKARVEGNKVRFTFQGVTTEVGKNAADIEGYLLKIGETKFGGSMEDQAQTLGGALSNLSDTVDRLAVKFGEAGFAPALNDALKSATANAQDLDKLAEGLGRISGQGIGAAVNAVTVLSQNLERLALVIALVSGPRAAALVAALAGRGVAALQAFRAATAAATAEQIALGAAQARAAAFNLAGARAQLVMAANIQNVAQRATALKAATANLTAMQAASTAAAANSAKLAAQATITGRALGGLATAGRGLLAIFGGPWGLAFTAAATAAVYLATREDETEKATDELKTATVELQQVLGDPSATNAAIGQARALTAEKLKAARATRTQLLEELNLQRAQLQRDRENAVGGRAANFGFTGIAQRRSGQVSRTQARLDAIETQIAYAEQSLDPLTASQPEWMRDMFAGMLNGAPSGGGAAGGGGADGGASKANRFADALARLKAQAAEAALELKAVNENWPDSQVDAARLKLQLYNDVAGLGTDINAKQRAELLKLADGLVEQNRQLSLAKMAQDIATNSAERYAEAITSLTDDVNGLADSLTELPDLTVKLPDGIFDELEADRDFAGAIGDSFGYAAEDALMHMDSIRDAAEALVSDLARIFIRRNVSLPIADMVTGWADSLMGNNAPAASGFDAGAASAASDAVLTQLGADGSNALASLTAAAQMAGTALDASMVPAIGQAVTSTITSATTDGIAAGALQGLTASAIAASAALSAMASQQAVSGISSIAMASGAPGFAMGGWTGGVGADQVAGVVHGQEYVINAEAVRKIGLPALHAINAGRKLPGFREGGFVGLRAAMRDMRPANDRASGGDPHFHYHGDASPDKARRFGKMAAAEYRRELARTAAQGIG